MSTVMDARTAPGFTAEDAMRFAAQFWFLVAVIGQWIFASYLLAAYGSGAVQGSLEQWNEVMPIAHTSGDTLGNSAVAMHLLLGFVVMSAGALQLVPQVRSRYPTFHRWNGRIYLLAVLIACIAGIYMTWARATSMGLLVKIGGSTSAVLMVTFGALALRSALARNFASHRRWALRLFLTASAAWFFRIILMVWFMINGGEPVGVDMQTGQGWFLDIMAFGQYLIPLAVLEIYLRAQSHASPSAKWVTAGALSSITVVMGVGIAAATIGLWAPHF